jgi:hypothetical protein
MPEGKPLRVQHLPAHRHSLRAGAPAPFPPIHPITEQGMTNPGEVLADLVSPTGLRLAEDLGCASVEI